MPLKKFYIIRTEDGTKTEPESDLRTGAGGSPVKKLIHDEGCDGSGSPSQT